MSLTGQGRKKVTPRNVKVPGIWENLTRCPTPANDNSSPNLHERERARLLPRPTTPYNRAMPSEPFEPTQWSLVLAAHDFASPHAHDALAALCHAYWYPIYAFIRRRGYSADAAEDLTQDFFARVLEEGFLAQVDREKGRFRAFLLAACKHSLANRRDHDRAQIREGIASHCLDRSRRMPRADHLLGARGIISRPRRCTSGDWAPDLAPAGLRAIAARVRAVGLARTSSRP